MLVTANYKLSFDSLRFELAGIDAWILVVDTRGINVWCAAGKNTFSTAEIILSVKKFRLAELVSHGQLILPQLGATGVSALEVKKGCGFKAMFGPVRASDLPRYLKNGNMADEDMRAVTFSMMERVVLIPVELFLTAKPLAVIALACFFFSGIGPDIYSIEAAWNRGLLLILAGLVGIFSGAVLTPLFLPWLPGRQFWLKGLLPGVITGFALWWLVGRQIGLVAGPALFICTSVISSHLAMNFTGTTPFTSPTGVEYEMRRGIPVQLAAAALALGLWLISPFLG